ncbi:hypothetical protein CVS40_12665 [Lucilia cuprina]|nr:hypothetical protein CVS40_12665 [Lucilia cuprina]
MEACNLVAHLNNPLLVKTLVDKLPNNHKLSWAMHVKDDKVPVVNQVVSPIGGKKTAFVNNHSVQAHSSKLFCIFCKSEEHKIQKCDEFQSFNLDAKWNVVEENKLCRLCIILIGCFRIIPIRIYCNSGSVATFAFLDEEVSGSKSDNRFLLYDVHTVNNLGLPKQSLNFEDIVRDNTYLKGLPIQSYTNGKPMVLIGLNNWRLAVPLKIREGARDQPIATKTRIGWTLQGSGTDSRSIPSLNIHTFGLLWKEDVIQLPESYEVSRHRLTCLQKMFKKDPQFQQTMQAEIDKLICKGYARKYAKASEFLEEIWCLQHNKKIHSGS